MKRFWRGLCLRGFYFESAEGKQTWHPDPADLLRLVELIKAAQKTPEYRAALTPAEEDKS